MENQINKYELVEEAALKYGKLNASGRFVEPKKIAFIDGAKWQAERMISKEAYEDSLNIQKASNAGYESKITELNREIKKMYSLEEVINIQEEWNIFNETQDSFNGKDDLTFKEWFEKFKKK